MTSFVYAGGYFQNYISFLDHPQAMPNIPKEEKCRLIQEKFKGLRAIIENSKEASCSYSEFKKACNISSNQVIGSLYLGDYDAFRQSGVDGTEYFDIIIKLNQHPFDDENIPKWFVYLKPETKILDLGVDDGVPNWITLVNKASGCFIAPEGNVEDWFSETFDLLDESLLTDKKVLVCCSYGVSRSATLVLAYLINRFQVSFNQALTFLKNIRPQVHPNPGFFYGLKDYDSKINCTQYRCV